MSGADRKRLREVRLVILGKRPANSLVNALYPVYVAVIVAGAYGVTTARQLFLSVDAKWLADHAGTPVGAIVTVGAVALMLTLVLLVGQVRGPVVPPLPYLDLVVNSPMPRKVTLLRNWRLSFGGCAIGGLLIGATCGVGLAMANVASPGALLPATLGGGLLGVVAAEFWLWGQVHGSRNGSSLPPGLHNALARLDIIALRRQAASNVTMGGAILFGDLRMVRLDAARPTRHCRRVRLRASGPLAVIARRDLLGLRRAPWSALSGLGLAAAGSAGLMLSLQSPQTPTMAPLVSLILAYLGFGALCEGLRLHADNSGTSRLLGLPYRDTAVAHLVVPLAVFEVSVILVSIGLLVTAAVGPTAILCGLGTGALLAGAHLMASFRGQPPIAAFSPVGGMPLMIFWYAKPLLATLVIGTATAAWAAHPATVWAAFLCLLVCTAAIAARGLALVDKRDRRS